MNIKEEPLETIISETKYSSENVLHDELVIASKDDPGMGSPVKVYIKREPWTLETVTNDSKSNCESPIVAHNFIKHKPELVMDDNLGICCVGETKIKEERWWEDGIIKEIKQPPVNLDALLQNKEKLAEMNKADCESASSRLTTDVYLDGSSDVENENGVTSDRDCKAVGKNVNKRPSVKQSRTCNKKPVVYQCKTCTKIFKSKVVLQRHIPTHSDARPFSCTCCGKTYKRKNDLQRHIVCHSDMRPFKCDQCEKCFYNKQGLKTHKLGMHSDNKQYQCDHCDKKYSIKGDLKRHMLSHAGLKNHQCNICSKRYLVKSHLKQHLLSHSDKNPFICDQCGMTFNHKSSIILHVKYHLAITEILKGGVKLSQTKSSGH